jgi:phage shock protein E
MKFLITLIIIFLNIFTMAFGDSVESISPAIAHKMHQDQQAILVDVREEDEIKLGTIEKSLHLPMSLMSSNRTLFNEKVSKTLNKEKTIILFCRSGRRSGIVANELKKDGFKVLNLGSFENWIKSGLK